DAAGAYGLPMLRLIGHELDRDQYPVVHENGLVMPGPGRPPDSPGKGPADAYHTQPGSSGPATREGQGPARQGSADGPGSTGAQALLLRRPGLTDGMRRDLGDATAAYPNMRIRFAPPVAWLLCETSPILGLTDRAYLLTRYPLAGSEPIASWAWWKPGIWIGPRHTNYGDGSICSFEPQHGTWSPGDGLVRLLDLPAVWIVRHLYLRHFGRWPGDQVIHTPFERLRDHRPGERCGCGSFQAYERCCRARDIAV